MTPHGTRALVTGGSRGIGLGYVEALVEAGCSVVLNHHRDSEFARAACERLGAACHAIEADLADPAAARTMVREAAKQLGGLDIVVSNAGICTFQPILDVSEATWQRHVDVNLSGAFHVVQESARIMVAAGRGGRIVFTTSAGAFRSNATQTHYCATKGGLHLLAMGFALELGPHGITVNCIAPGWVHTELNDAASRDPSIHGPWLKAHCPVGRISTPADLKGALTFLVSREAAYVNGATLSVDGGWNAQL